MQESAKILVVDDFVENRLLLKILLEDDYHIVEADSGEACLAIIKTETPDLILLDVNMPGLNGYQVCTKLKSSADTSSIPVIFVSGLDSEKERLVGFSAGGDDYINKPIDPFDLINKVKLWIEKKSCQNE